MTDSKSPEKSTISYEVDCLKSPDGQMTPETRAVVVESPLTIEIKDIGAYTIMSTPQEKLQLAVGFAFSEGLIEERDDIGSMMLCPDDPAVVRMQLAVTPKAAKAGRNLLIVSSCGLCGSENIEQILANLPVVPDTLSLSAERLVAMPRELRDSQRIFRFTGGTHAVGLFDGDSGDMLCCCEDLGRHSAFDKAVGTCILAGGVPRGAAAALSGRISLELVAKAVRAGIELIAAVSAPSSLAIRAAEKCNITLCGFVRGDDATIYCNSGRIVR